MRTFLNNYNDVLCIILRCENELQYFHIRVNTIGIIYSTNEIWLCISSLWQQPWLLSNKSILITKFVEPDILAKKFINLFPYCFNKHTISSFSRNTINSDKMFIIKYSGIKSCYIQHILTSFCKKTLHGSLGRDLFVRKEVYNINVIWLL